MQIEIEDYPEHKNGHRYTGRELNIHCTAKHKTIKARIRCLGKNKRYPWEMTLIGVRADLFMSTEKMKEIAHYEPTDEHPYFRLFIGDVCFHRPEKS